MRVLPGGRQVGAQTDTIQSRTKGLSVDRMMRDMRIIKFIVESPAASVASRRPVTTTGS